MVSADINGRIGETDILTEKDAVYLINEEIERPFPGFSEKLIGFDIDDPTEFELEIPVDFSDPDIAGQTVNFHVTIKDIKHRVLPELDDAFAQSIGEGHKTLGDLKEEIGKSLKEEAESESSRSYRESLILELMEVSSITLPPLLIEHEANRMMEEQERMVTQASMVFDDYIKSIGKTREELNEEFEKTAKDQLMRSFIMSKLSEEESVDITDGDVDGRIKELFANSEEEMPDSSRTDEMKEYIRSSMKVEHTIEKLESIAQGDESKEAQKEQNTEEETKGGDDAPKS
jgi:trigger factor